MKKLFALLIIVVFLISPIALASANQETTQIKSKDTKSKIRVIANTISENDIKLFKAKGCSIKHKLKDKTSLDCPEEIVPELNVKEARIFHIMDLDADNQIEADKVWAEGITGSGVNVAILDTGIDIDHSELQDSYLGGYDFASNDNVPEDDNGHGTHVAGIITSNGNDANSKGVAPSTGIYMFKVCDADGYCYEDDMMAAMEAAVETDAKVMSISIGGGSFTTENCDSDTLAAKVNWVVSNGITVVVAAGNDGSGVSSPGCASGAIGVGAVDKTNNVPYWSGRGKALDITAPGVSIYSTIINGYGTKSGTSMATPHVAGVVALLLDADSSLTTNEIKTVLYDTASPVNKCYGLRCYRYGCWQAEVTCTPEITGAGIVNAYDAYLSVKPTGPECSIDADCDDGLYCNGAETCQAGECQAGTPIDCSANNLPEISTCYNNPDNNPFTWDYAHSFLSVCNENTDSCTTGTQTLTHECRDNDPLDGTNNITCGAQCDQDSDCKDTNCDYLDGCEGNDYYDYHDVENDCLGDCSCENNACGEPTVYTNDPRCAECVDNDGDNHYAIAPNCPAGDDCDDTDASIYPGATEVCNSKDDDCNGSIDEGGVCDSVLCWSADYQYLYRNSNQMRKFCKCAMGTYGYNSYSYNRGRRTVYYYTNSRNNENWDTSSTRSYRSIYRVRCADNNWYYTNIDYYYG